MIQTTEPVSRLDKVATYTLIATAALASLSFWPSPYFAIEAVKTIILAIGTITSAALFLVLALREKSLRLPPRALAWTGALLTLSTIISSAQSGHFMKSFFGQGFEVGTGSFLVLLLVSSWVAFTAVARRVDRVMVIYTAIGGAFIVLYLLHVLRFMFGTGFMSLGILNSLTSTLVGSWYSIGIYSGIVAIIAMASIMFLPMPARFKNLYWVLVVASAFGMLIIGAKEIWEAAALVFLGLAVYIWKSDRKKALIPLVACAISFILVFQGNAIATPINNSIKASYSELSLPWQMTLDVASGELKAQPLFGTGPNRFSQAFLAYKPAGINPTDLWGVEFNSGFGFIPTFIVTEGILGSIIWIVFFIFFGILGYRSLRTPVRTSEGDLGIMESEQPYARFAIVSSFAAATFLWVMAMLYSTPHAIIYYAFIMTGIWLGASVAYGRLTSIELKPQQGTRMYKIVHVGAVAALSVIILWGLVYLKDTIALAYFDKGLTELTVDGNPVMAEKHFTAALKLHPTDIYWQGRTESVLGQARALINSASSNPSASTTVVAAQASALVNQALQYAQSAIVADSSNYYNYLSAARVAEVANGLRMNQSYETGVAAYINAIRLNPQNPSLYVSLARFQAGNNKLDDAIQTIGASLQVKNNYLESVFLLSQVEAVKGNLPDAITAAQFAVKLNPNNPLLYFQLGLFQYTAGKYADSAVTLAQAIKVQPDYSNARYFLGLSQARLGLNSDAIAQFEELAQANPSNQEIPAILSALRSGKSLFAGAQPTLKTPPEKRTTPPLPEKSSKKAK